MNSLDRGLTAAQAYTPYGGYARLREKLVSLGSADRRSIVWALALLTAAIGAAFGLNAAGYPAQPVWALAVLGLFSAIAERDSVAVTDRIEMSASFLPTVFAAVALGPLAAFCVGVISNASDFRRHYFLRWLVYTPIRALTGAASGLVASAVTTHMSGTGGYLVASLLASLTSIGVDAVFVCVTLAIRRRGDAIGYMRAVTPIFALSLPLYTPVVGLFVYGYHAYSLWVVVVVFVPVLALQRLIRLNQEQVVATRRLAAANSRLLTANVRFATGLVAMLEESDPYTAGHSLAVATYSRDIAQRMGLSDEEVDLVHLCALVHDIGKVRVRREVLEKPGPLTLDERREMEKHPEYGELLLRKVEVEDHGRVGKIVRHHHERIDGEGYPDRLSESEIPLLSKIIAVADAYNAMTSERPYREAMPSQVARLRLAQAVGSQFDTSVVAAFEAILATADEDYRTGTDSRFVFDWNEAVTDERVEPLSLRAVS